MGLEMTTVNDGYELYGPPIMTRDEVIALVGRRLRRFNPEDNTAIFNDQLGDGLSYSGDGIYVYDPADYDDADFDQSAEDGYIDLDQFAKEVEQWNPPSLLSETIEPRPGFVTDQ